MTICPIALAVGCQKCPAFLLCPLTTVLGNLQEKNKVNPPNKFFGKNFLPEKKNQITITGRNTYDSVRSKLRHLEEKFELWEESYPPEKNKHEEPKKE